MSAVTLFELFEHDAPPLMQPEVGRARRNGRTDDTYRPATGPLRRSAHFDLDADVVLYSGGCEDLLRTLPDSCVQLVVTSPPYNIGKSYGLKLRNRIIWHFEHGLHASRRFSGRYERARLWHYGAGLLHRERGWSP